MRILGVFVNPAEEQSSKTADVVGHPVSSPLDAIISSHGP